MLLIHCIVVKPSRGDFKPQKHISGCDTTSIRRAIRENTHGEHGACRPNGCRGRLAELILVSALSLGNLHKLVLHRFLMQTHTHTHMNVHTRRAAGWEETASIALSNKNSPATAPAWCKWLRKPQMALRYSTFFSCWPVIQRTDETHLRPRPHYKH